MHSRPCVLFILVVVGCLLLPARVAARGWERWERPVQGAVLRAFSVGPDRFAAGQHRGIDLAAPPGGRVRAACGGRVSFAGRVPRGGLTVSVRCGPLVATYQHLGATAVRRGQVVLPGAPIGTAGRPHPRPHVHLGARNAATGAYVDPLALLAGSPPGSPPPLPAARRPRPPGPGRAPLARRPLPAAPVPAARPLPVVRELPVARGPLPAGPVPAPAARPLPVVREPVAHPPASQGGRLPWPVWLGLALVGLGLPLGGGMVTFHRRRRRAPTLAPTA